jgi:secretion/DNA translocation related CpaE-like protein
VSSSMPTAHRRPLIVTADPELLDDLLRLTAEVGMIADAATDPGSARSCYETASVVFIGIDKAEACVRAGFPRRAGVILIGRHEGGLPDWAEADDLGVDHIVTLPAAEPWLLERLASSEVDSDGVIVTVTGGRGGAGASVLAGALAITGARFGMRTLLVDADPLGGGADLVLGWEDMEGLRWPELSGASGRFSAPALVDALPGRSDLVVLSWDRGEPATVPSEAMMATLDAARRGRDLVVIDVPRHIDETTALALRSADRAYLVVPAELRACAAATRVAATMLPHAPSLSLVVRHPGPAGLTINAVVEAVHLPLAGAMRTEPLLPKELERGVPPAASGRGPLAVLCERLLGDVAMTGMAAA